MNKYLLSFLIILFCTNTTVFAKNTITSDFLVERIISEDASLKEKQKVITYFMKRGLTLKKNEMCELLNYLTSCKSDLFSPIMDLIDNCAEFESIEHEKMESLVFSLINIHVGNIDRVERLLGLMIGFHAAHPDPVRKKIYDKRVRILSLNLLRRNPDFLYHYSETNPGWFPVDIKEVRDFILNQLKIEKDHNKKLQVITLISKVMKAYLQERDMPGFVKLTKSSNLELAGGASKLLSSITHHNEIKDWARWWSMNKTDFRIIDRAVLVFCTPDDFTKDLRSLAMSQIRCYSSLEGVTKLSKEQWQLIFRLAENEEIDQHTRLMAFKLLSIIKKDIECEKQYKRLVCSLLNDARFHVLIFVAMGDEINNSAAYRTEAIKILNNKSMNNLSRSFAAYALSKVVKGKKNIAVETVNLLNDCSFNNRPGRVAVTSLCALTGQDHGTDIEAWKTCVEAMPAD